MVDKAPTTGDGHGGGVAAFDLGGDEGVAAFGDGDGEGVAACGDGDGDVNMGGTHIQELPSGGRKRKSGGSNGSEGEWASGRRVKKGVIISGVGDAGIPVGPLFPEGSSLVSSLGENHGKTQIDMDAEIAEALQAEGYNTNRPYQIREDDESHPEDDARQHQETEVSADADSPLDEITLQLLAGLEQPDVSSDDIIDCLHDSDAEEETFDDDNDGIDGQNTLN